LDLLVVIEAMYRQDDTKAANLLGRRWPCWCCIHLHLNCI